jgi:sigma-B regulation protein RsbU (phosphoserine phosphatase)
MLISLSLGGLLLLSAVFAYGVSNMRRGIIEDIESFSSDLTAQRAQALGAIREYELRTTAADKAAIIDEKLAVIEGQTRALADMATRIYSNPDAFSPRAIDYLRAGQENTPVPHIRTAGGVDLDDIRAEVYLAANVQDILRRIDVVDMGIVTNYIGGESGYFMAVDKGAANPENKNYDSTARPWYIGAKEKGDIYWSDVFLDSSGRGISMSCSMPFYDTRDNTLKGVAACGIVLDNFRSIINETNIDGQGYAFLLNDTGKILISPHMSTYVSSDDGVPALRNLLQSDEAQVRDLAAHMTKGENGVAQLRLDGEDVYVGYAPLNRNNWSVGVAISRNDVIKPVYDMRQQVLALLDTAEKAMNDEISRTAALLFLCGIFVAIPAAIALSLRFANRLTKPIISLNRGVRTAGEGNLDAEIAVESNDEIGQLAVAFNAMTLRLKDYIRNLSEATAERERVSAELNVAQRIQASMLPSIFPPFPDRREFDLYAEMHPAKVVGGDFYDFFLVDENRLGVVIADVSGKSVPAALFMVIARTLLREHLQFRKEPEEVFLNVNNLLADNNETAMFVTAFMGVLEIDTGVFTYVNAGHIPPAIRRGEGDFAWLEVDPGFVLGGLPDIAFGAARTRFFSGDMLFMYTDGVSEANDTRGKLFTEERILDTLNASARAVESAAGCVTAVRESVTDFADDVEQSDDITMLALLYNGASNTKTLTLAADVCALDELVAFIGACLDESGFPKEEQNGVQLAAEEVFVNIARYAYPEGGGAVKITCVCGAKRIVVTVEDSGRPYNPLLREDPDIALPAEARGIGGLGVYITKELMDTVYYDFRDGKNLLTMVKDVRAAVQ